MSEITGSIASRWYEFLRECIFEGLMARRWDVVAIERWCLQRVSTRFLKQRGRKEARQNGPERDAAGQAPRRGRRENRKLYWNRDDDSRFFPSLGFLVCQRPKHPVNYASKSFQSHIFLTTKSPLYQVAKQWQLFLFNEFIIFISNKNYFEIIFICLNGKLNNIIITERKR